MNTAEQTHSPNDAQIESVDPAVLRYGHSKRRLIVAGVAIIVIGFGTLSGWAALAPLRTATIAPGIVKVSGERKTIQHLEGGIIREILVREGSRVEAGQVLLRLSDVTARARYALVRVEHDALSAELARLEAERDQRASPIFSASLLSRRADSEVAGLIDGELNLFNSRRAALKGQFDVLVQRQYQAREKIAGRITEISATKTQLGFIQEEIFGAESLLETGMYLKTRYFALKRSEADLEGLIGRLTADIAETEAQIGEADLRMIDLRNQVRKEVTDRIQDVRARLRDASERLDATRDALDRVEVLAPDTGTVMGLQVHTPGGVIKPGAAIMEIVPLDDRLVVEAQVQPEDIDRVWVGMPAEVRFTAFNTRTTPVFPARLSRISADRFADTSRGKAYYVARVELDTAILGDIVLQPGMPAEVYLVAGQRTPFDYLTKPIREQIRRGMTER